MTGCPPHDVPDAHYPDSSRNCRIEVKVIPSYHCTIGCHYCYNTGTDKTLYSPSPEKVKDQLDRIFQDRKNANAIVEIIGGEPLSSEVFPVTLGIIGQLKDMDADIKIVVQTGSPAIDRLLAIIPLIDGLSYSVDISSSPKAKNIRNLPEVCRECKNQSVITQVQTILNPTDKQETIVDFIRTCESYGAGWIGLEYPQYQRYSKDEMDNQIPAYQTIIEAFGQKSRITVGGAIIESALDYLHGTIYSSSCMCGEKSITVQPDGTITPSLHFFLNQEIPLQDFAGYKKNRSNELRKGVCAGCEYWRVCMGGCMAHAGFLTGTPANRDEEYCYILTNVLKSL